MSSPQRLHAAETAPRRPTRAGTELLRGTVCALLPDFGQAHLETADGRQLALTGHTAGIDLRNLRVGQVLECEVTLVQPRVLHAQPVAQ